MKPLSWSEYNAWLNYRDDWNRRYILGIKDPPNYVMILGTDIHNLVQEKDKKASDVIMSALIMKYTPDELRNITKIKQNFNLSFTETEKKVEAVIEGIPTIAYWDAYDEEDGTLIEIKTGRRLWDWNKVCGHNQMLFYTLQAEEIGVKLSQVKLFTASTANGKCETFVFRYTKKEKEDFRKQLKEQWELMKPYHELRK